MVTKKQLAALAYGRKIRQAKLAKRKQTKTKNKRSRRRTKAVFIDTLKDAAKTAGTTVAETASTFGEKISEYSKKFKAAGDIIGDFITPFTFVTKAFETGKRFKDAITAFFEEERKLDTNKLKIVIGNMKKNMKRRNPDYVNGVLWNKLTEIEKNIIYIDLLTSQGEDKQAKEVIIYTLRLLSIALSDYAELMGR